MGRVMDRAERFAKRYVKPKPQADTRSMDEKMAEFYALYGRDGRERAHRRLKKVKSNASVT